MQAPIFIPPPVNNTKKCNKCGLQYPTKEDACTHCKDLTDQEIKELKSKLQEEHKGNSNLGKLFIYVAILLVIAMLIASNT